MAEPELYIGLMSGTSVDGIDAALFAVDDNACRLRATHALPLPTALRNAINAISLPGDNEIERLGDDAEADAAIRRNRATSPAAAERAASGQRAGAGQRRRPRRDVPRDLLLNDDDDGVA